MDTRPTERYEPMQILYVEDDPDIRDLVGIALEGEGFELIDCASGAEALARAQESRPELILIDVMMPEMDGPTTLAHLRELPHLAETPVIFMTAKAQPAEVAHYRSLGARDVIVKPFDPMTLADQIRAILERDA